MILAIPSIVFSGTAITSGKASAIVTATGMQTEVGKIASLLNQTQKQATPLAKRPKRTGQTSIVGGHLRRCADDVVVHASPKETLTEESHARCGRSCHYGGSGNIYRSSSRSTAHGVRKWPNATPIIRQSDHQLKRSGNVNVIASDKTGTLTQTK